MSQGSPVTDKDTGGGKTFVGLFHCDSAFIETLLNPYEFFHLFEDMRMLSCKRIYNNVYMGMVFLLNKFLGSF